MSRPKLDREEQDILDAFENGSLKRVKNLGGELARHREIAAATFRKDSRINIRISSRDLRALQKKALAEGIPYQTLVASVLHKFVEGRLAEKSWPANASSASDRRIRRRWAGRRMRFAYPAYEIPALT